MRSIKLIQNLYQPGRAAPHRKQASIGSVEAQRATFDALARHSRRHVRRRRHWLLIHVAIAVAAYLLGGLTVLLVVLW